MVEVDFLYESYRRLVGFEIYIYLCIVNNNTMIQKVVISNFYSIREPLEVSFEASKEKQYSEDWIVQIGNTRLLKALLLYGANGSGKTNILYALDFLRHTVLNVPMGVVRRFHICVSPWILRVITQTLHLIFIFSSGLCGIGTLFHCLLYILAKKNYVFTTMATAARRCIRESTTAKRVLM